MATDVERLFMCLFAMCLIKSIVFLKTELFVFLQLSLEISLFWIQVLYCWYIYLQIFSPTVMLVFLLS